MAAADYLDKVTHGALQILDRVDAGEVERRLAAHDVAIAFGRTAFECREGCATIDLTVRLLARLLPSLTICDCDGADVERRFERLATEINPRIEIERSINPTATVICVGPNTPRYKNSIHVGSDGWIGTVSRERPVHCGNSAIPFGAGAAAVIAVANVFREIFRDGLEKGGPDSEVSVDLLRFAQGDASWAVKFPDKADIGEVHLAGLGAIGNAVVWALARTKGLTGKVVAIDPEAVELTNLQRYVLARRTDIGLAKTALVQREFADAGSAVEVDRQEVAWSHFISCRGNHSLELVATALDTPGDRVMVQGSLPRRVLNAWTQPGDCGVSRHSFDEPNACLACLYLREATERDEDVAVAEDLKIPHLQARVRLMLQAGIPVDLDFLTEVAKANGLELSELAKFQGSNISAFRREAVCGGLVIADVAGTSSLQVPMAFQSAMAGIMLAAEIVADRLALRSDVLPTKTVVDLLRPFPSELNVPVLKRDAGTARCICADDDYLMAYRRKYRTG